MTDEEWREIERFPHYHVSNLGNVRRNTAETARNVSVSDQGFPIITLYASDSKTRYLRQINVLVASAFLPTPKFDNETAVWHIDGNLLNCRADNLKWDTRGRVLAWNDMHRRGCPKFRTARVRNNRTGEVYDNAYHCGMVEGELEETIMWKIDNNSPRYSYIGVNDL